VRLPLREVKRTASGCSVAAFRPRFAAFELQIPECLHVVVTASVPGGEKVECRDGGGSGGGSGGGARRRKNSSRGNGEEPTQVSDKDE